MQASGAAPSGRSGCAYPCFVLFFLHVKASSILHIDQLDWRSDFVHAIISEVLLFLCCAICFLNFLPNSQPSIGSTETLLWSLSDLDCQGSYSGHRCLSYMLCVFVF